jgi:hypothetical protein
MKKQKKRSLPKKKKSSLVSKGKLFKGVIDAGTVYGVLLLAIILGGAYMMLGNISPNIASPDQNQLVIPKKPNDTSTHSNLQLKYFTAITLTPSPTDTPTPTPTPTQPPPAPAGSGNQTGPGNSAPNGPGGNPGGAPAAPGAM